MANPIVRGFGKLTRFSGRDTRGEFWPYAGAVIALTMIMGSMAAGIVRGRIIEDLAPDSAPQVGIAPVAPSDPVWLEVVEAPPPRMPPMPVSALLPASGRHGHPDHRPAGGGSGATTHDREATVRSPPDPRNDWSTPG